MSKKISKMELAEMIWDEYYTLSVTPLQAMANLWEEYASGTLYSWANETFDVGHNELLKIISVLTRDLRKMDLSKTAYGHTQ
jgi:hypothetical protein